jgi:uncharacterized membrane protein
MVLKAVQFLAVTLTALALLPSGAHLLALPNKITLLQDAYYIVQHSYRGWALLGAVLIAALIANTTLAILVRNRPAPFWFATLGSVAVAATLAIFFLWIYPANQLTANWSTVPDNWESLRSQWEYGHAANAILTFIGLCAVTCSVLSYRE